MKDLRRLHATMLMNGFAAFSVDTIRWVADTALIRVYPGSRYHWGRVTWNRGQGQDQAAQLSGLTEGVPVSRELLNRATDEWITQHENSGYPFAAVIPDSLRLHEGAISGSIRLDPGPYILLDSVLNRTEVRLSQPVFHRITRLRPGQPFDQSAIRQADERLKGTGIFSTQRDAQPGFFDDRAWIYLYPVATAANRFDGWVGFGSSGESDNSFGFMGAADLHLFNLTGQAERWSVIWSRNQDRSQRFYIATDFPYPAGLPVGLAASFMLRRQDTSWINLEAGVEIPYSFKPGHHLSWQFKFRGSDLLTIADSLETLVYHPFTLAMTGFRYRASVLDNPLNPARGYVLNGSWLTGVRRSEQFNSRVQHEVGVSADLFMKLPGRLVLRTFIGSEFRISDDLPYNEFLHLGGYLTLRGFDEDIFRVPGFARASLELRLLLDEFSHLLVFADQAWLATRLPGEPGAWPFGMGAGAQVKTGGGILNIYAAFGSNSLRELTLRSARIHLGYIGLF